MEPFDRAQFFLSLFLFLVRFQEHGAQRRTQRQRVDGGQADGDGHRQTELAVPVMKLTGMNTAIITRVIDTIAPEISLIASIDAFNGDL